MDGIELPFENVLDYSAFTVRIAEADVPHLPSILRSIPSPEVSRLQANLALVRSRFGYSSMAHNEERLAKAMSRQPPGAARPHEYLASLVKHNAIHEDALQTMMRVLLYRAAQRRGEVPRGER